MGATLLVLQKALEDTALPRAPALKNSTHPSPPLSSHLLSIYIPLHFLSTVLHCSLVLTLGSFGL